MQANMVAAMANPGLGAALERAPCVSDVALCAAILTAVLLVVRMLMPEIPLDYTVTYALFLTFLKMITTPVVFWTTNATIEKLGVSGQAALVRRFARHQAQLLFTTGQTLLMYFYLPIFALSLLYMTICNIEFGIYFMKSYFTIESFIFMLIKLTFSIYFLKFFIKNPMSGFMMTAIGTSSYDSNKFNLVKFFILFIFFKVFMEVLRKPYMLYGTKFQVTLQANKNNNARSAHL